VTTFTTSTPPSQVVATLQAASPDGLINLANVQFATPEQYNAATQAYFAQCQVGEFQKTPCNAPCGGTGIAVRARGRIGGGTVGCPVETTWNEFCAGPPCGATAPPPTDCYEAGPAGRDKPCCPGLSYNDGECY
jgi:hypothetical protein